MGHLFETCPSGISNEYYAMAIGGKSTSAKTYLEKNFATFADADLEALIQHALEAMNKTTSSDQALTEKNCSVAIIGVGDGGNFKELSADELTKFLDKLEKKDEPDVAMDDAAPAAAAAPAEGGDGAAPMDTA